MSVNGVQITSNLTNARFTKYLPDYIRAAMFNRVYDILGKPIPGNADMYRSSSIVLNFLSDLEPGTAAIPENTDVTPEGFRDATATITPTSRYKAIQVSELLMNQAGTNYAQERFELLGKNQAESVDLLAQAAAVQGAIAFKGAGATARTSIDAGTATHLLTAAKFTNASADLQNFKVPGWEDPKSGLSKWFAILHPYAFADLRADTTILDVGKYQMSSIILQHELGELGPFKLIVTPWAKTFWGGGAANASAIETTLNGAVNALATTIVVAANTNMDVGDRVMIGTHETANTHYATNEIVTITGINSTTITVAGEGANGGLRFDHAHGAAVSNDDNVGTVVVGGPESLMKVYDPQVGEFGTVVGPKKEGLLDQFDSLAWKWYGAYARPIETRIVRYEVSFGRDA
jgi:N4-gp56 family major capsid protein